MVGFVGDYGLDDDGGVLVDEDVIDGLAPFLL